MNDSHHQQHSVGCGHGRPGWGWLFIAFALLATVLLWQDHRTHVLGVFPYLILIACPLMHLLHRHGRRHQGNHDHGRA